MRNVNRIYQKVALTLVSVAALGVAIVWVSPGYDGAAESPQISPPYTDSRPEPESQPQSPPSQFTTTAAQPAENENPQPERAGTVSVWGAVETDFAVGTNHVRVVLYSLSLERSFVTYSNANGYFYIDGVVPAKDYTLWAMPAGMFQRYVREGMDISSDVAALSVVLEALPVATLTGQVVSTDGTGVASFGIKIRSSVNSIWSSTVITGSDGNFQVENVPIGQVEFLSSFGQAMIITGHVFEGDVQSPLILVVDEGPYEINGRVYDQYNTLVDGAIVKLGWVNTRGETRSVVNRHSITDPDGQFSIKGIGPGQHDLMLTAATGSTYRQTIDIGEYSTDLTILLSQTPLSN